MIEQCVKKNKQKVMARIYLWEVKKKKKVRATMSFWSGDNTVC